MQTLILHVLSDSSAVADFSGQPVVV